MRERSRKMRASHRTCVPTVEKTSLSSARPSVTHGSAAQSRGEPMTRLVIRLAKRRRSDKVIYMGGFAQFGLNRFKRGKNASVNLNYIWILISSIAAILCAVQSLQGGGGVGC